MYGLPSLHASNENPHGQENMSCEAMVVYYIILGKLMSISILPECNPYIDAVNQLNREAFGSDVEPKLIKLLRERDELLISLVAIDDDKIIGHVCASPVTINGNNHSIAGIGPLSVCKSRRCQGIGGMLMEEVIAQLRNNDYAAAVLLGDPNYYHRFGFSSGAAFGLQNEYNADDAFMAMELQHNSLVKISGLVRYVSAFKEQGA